MACNSCKKKPANNITNLSTDINHDDLKKAYHYVSRNASMTDEKWDFVEQVYRDLFPSAQKINRSCSPCLTQLTKVIIHEYEKIRK